MNELLLVKFLHVVGFAYWLGGDLGVYLSSYYVVDREQPVSVRVAMAKFLFALDMAPRIAMTMMLPLGLHLAWKMGLLDFSALTMAMIWLICSLWLANVLNLHYRGHSAGIAWLTKIDFWFRVLLSSGLIVVGAISLLTNQLPLAHWLAAKLLIFGGLIGCGLMIRIKLKPFGPAFGKLASGAATDEDEQLLDSSLSATRPFALLIWTGIFLSAAFGLHLI